MKIFISLLLIFFLCSCKDKPNDNSSTKINSCSDTVNHYHTVQDPGIYTIQVPGGTISLQQWDSTLNPEQLVAKPGKQRTRKLNMNSDTYAGSFIKDREFEGLKLKLFSLPQNGNISGYRKSF
jgi:hypothetical protein